MNVASISSPSSDLLRASWRDLARPPGNGRLSHTALPGGALATSQRTRIATTNLPYKGGAEGEEVRGRGSERGGGGGEGVRGGEITMRSLKLRPAKEWIFW